MVMEAIQASAVQPAVAGYRGAGEARPAAAAGSGPADRVAISDQARQLSAQLAATEGPELQLSPERLRQLIERVEGAEAPAE